MSIIAVRQDDGENAEFLFGASEKQVVDIHFWGGHIRKGVETYPGTSRPYAVTVADDVIRVCQVDNCYVGDNDVLAKFSTADAVRIALAILQMADFCSKEEV